VGISIKLFNYSRTFCLQQHEPLSCLRVESPKRKMGFRIRGIGTETTERERYLVALVLDVILY
jgi:hypothetical protein